MLNYFENWLKALSYSFSVKALPVTSITQSRPSFLCGRNTERKWRKERRVNSYMAISFFTVYTFALKAISRSERPVICYRNVIRKPMSCLHFGACLFLNLSFCSKCCKMGISRMDKGKWKRRLVRWFLWANSPKLFRPVILLKVGKTET